MFKSILSIFLFLLLVNSLAAQTDLAEFRKYQLSFPRVKEALDKYNDSLNLMFIRKNILYPCKDIYLRAFKSQNELELWARNNDNTDYKLVKVFRVCALSGLLGPKMEKGDRQVPEGYYYIDEFNPKSEYYLSLLLNYPNFADRLNAKDRTTDLGGEIYIHGGCVTIGCLPMTDEGIKQLYIICLNAKLNGQENIPVHIFPTRFTKPGVIYLNREYANDLNKMQFWNELKEGYDYFEKYHRLFPVICTPNGHYAY